MKRILAFVIALTLCLGLTACGSSDGSVSTPAPAPTSTPTPTPKPAPTPTPTPAPTPTPTPTPKTKEYPLKTYSRSINFGQGYSCDATLRVGSWVKASDSDAVRSAWEAVGGKGSVPDCSQFRTNAWQTAQFFQTSTSIMFFGTISVKDTTPGDFTISDTANHSIYLGVERSATEHTYEDSYVEYSNSGKFQHSQGEVHYARMVEVIPKMQSRSWGPVPFVVCFGAALTPEFPDGRPEIYEALWAFGSENSFNIYSSWIDDVPVKSN